MHRHYHTFIYSALCHNLNHGPKLIRNKLGLIIGLIKDLEIKQLVILGLIPRIKTLLWIQYPL